MELQSEKLKCELALMHDFSPIDGFVILDRYSKSEVDARDLLAVIQIEFIFTSFNLQETELFIRRYDRIGGKRIKYQEFIEALMPRE
jgi:hypothetical protein